LRGEFIDVGECRLYYYASGTRGGGEPLLFIHGFPTSSHLWARVVPLVPPGHRVVVPDLLGFGRSDLPSGRGTATDLTIARHASRLTRLLDVLGIDQACVVGHGVGAAIALALQRAQPQRVNRLALVNPTVPLSRRAPAYRTFGAPLPVLRLLPAGILLRLLRRRVLQLYRDSAGHGPAVDHYLRPFHGPQGRSALLEHLRGLLTADLESESEDCLTETPTLPAPPTSVICGDEDPLLPTSSAAQLQAGLPGSTLDWVNGGHFCPEESPEQLAERLRQLLAAG
jgi:pimeloyl-ACP methyl ester carboxylesterase